MRPLIYSQWSTDAAHSANELVLEHPEADTSILSEWSGALVEAAEQFDSNPAFTRRIYAGVSEAMVNVFHHAYHEGVASALRASAKRDATGLTIEIADRGCGFDDQAWLDFQAMATGWAENSGPMQPLCTSHRGKGLVDMVRVLDGRAGTFSIISGVRRIALTERGARNVAIDIPPKYDFGTLVRWRVEVAEASPCQ